MYCHLVGRGTRDAATHPVVHRTALSMKNYPVQNVKSAAAETETPGLKSRHPFTFLSPFPYLQKGTQVLGVQRILLL